jgi:hypothetical protein
MRQLLAVLVLLQAAVAQADGRPILDTLVLGSAQWLIVGALGFAYFTWQRLGRGRLSEKLSKTLPDIVVFAAEGDLANVSAKLDAGIDPNSAGPSGQTALMLAARNGHIETMRLLLERGADPALRTKTGSTAEDIAKTYKHIECAQILAQNKHT